MPKEYSLCSAVTGRGPLLNEELLGEALEPYGGSVTIATKFGWQPNPARVNNPADADLCAGQAKQLGLECLTLHVGWGLEDDDDAFRLIDAVLDASARYSVPLYVETHRATIFQDMWRTVGFHRRFPSLEFNGDFSHWYTGQEMVYGGFEKKLEFIAPILSNVRFLHGRIGNPGSIQVDLGDGNPEQHPYILHFRMLWTAAIAGYMAASATRQPFLTFTPELLAADIYYARRFRDVEESDRWQQSLLLRQIAFECFRHAQQPEHDT
ncbi:MAG: hypothetical protein PW789_12645 [Edaphobacter sp.]|uniref:hypothetical protein n=1 Tax=Edaphobacter sp. TaxID=1934404 RepID=UPI0023957FB3|nr:hypothetical protein [Edaphobacter sp.]MDE1177433.1 hypothetical protein [Edaphobacter sp.]